MVDKIVLMAGCAPVPPAPPVEGCCCEGGNMPLTVTNDVDLTLLATAVGTCGINVPPRIVGHRRRAVGVEGAVMFAGNTGAFLPVTGNFTDIVDDTTGTMCPANQPYVVLPCTGHWRLWTMATLGGVVTPGATHGLGLLVNGVMQNRRFWPAPNGTISQGECYFVYNYNAGDQVSLAVWSEDPQVLQSGSFHILAELLSV